MSERFIKIEGNSRKFWQVATEGPAYVARFGRLNTEGQVRSMMFPRQTEAIKKKDKLTRQKIREGYKLQEETAPNSELVSSQAIDSLQVGEHVEESAQGLSEWLTACLKNDISPTLFSRIWEQFIETGEETLSVPGISYVNDGADFEYWEDTIDTRDEISDFYKEAYDNQADKFIILDDNAFISIVALRGDPGAQAIENCVVQRASVVVTAGNINWPEELSAGAPIISIWIGALEGVAKLRDGREITIQA